MKLTLSLALLCTLSSTARALTCLQCTNSNDVTCSLPNTVECQIGEMCFNAFITEFDGSQRIYRDCAGAAVCPVLGAGLIQTNVGGRHTIATTDCCEADQCNGAELPYQDVQSPNGKTCPGTSPPTSTFLATVECRGLEDTCFSGTAVQSGSQVTVGGCGRSNVCDVTGELQQLPFINAGLIPEPLTCTVITTTTTTSTATATATATTEPLTTVYTPSSELLAKIKALVEEMKLLSTAMKLDLLHQDQVVLLQLHLQLLDYQQQLLLQQEELPMDHHHQLPLYYQQCLMVNHHQLLLHQMHLSLCGQQNLLQLFYHQQLVLHHLQQLLHGHHDHLLPHYHSYLLHYHHKYHPTTEAPTTSTQAPTTSTQAPTTTPV